jgi:hypothetical protein
MRGLWLVALGVTLASAEAGASGHDRAPLAPICEPRSAIEIEIDGRVVGWWEEIQSVHPSLIFLLGLPEWAPWSTPRVAPSKSDHRPRVREW